MKTYDRIWESGADDEFRTSLQEPELALLKTRKRLLDLGCGDGKSLLFLAKNHEVTGLDYSQKAVEIVRKRLEEKKLPGRVILGDLYEPLPFPNDSFDAVIAYQSINHGTIEQIRGTLREIQRVLKKDGLFLLKIGNKEKYEWKEENGLYKGIFNTYKEIAPNTYDVVAGEEKGVVHYMFTRENLLRELEEAGFTLIDLREEGHHFIANFRKK